MSAATPPAPDQEVDRYQAVRQYSLLEILAVWAAAAVPMGLLAKAPTAIGCSTTEPSRLCRVPTA